MYAALAATSLSLGYWIGATSALRLQTEKTTSEKAAPSSSLDSDSENTDGNESDDSDLSTTAGEELSSLQFEPSEDCKMVRLERC